MRSRRAKSKDCPADITVDLFPILCKKWWSGWCGRLVRSGPEDVRVAVRRLCSLDRLLFGTQVELRMDGEGMACQHKAFGND